MRKNIVFQVLMSLLLVGTSVMVAGCGGGGGGGGAAQASNNPTPPPTPDVKFTITSSAESPGQITPNVPKNVTQGGSQKYTATPPAGEYTTWVIDGVTTTVVGDTYTFTSVQGPHTVYVFFTTIAPPPTCSIAGAVTGGTQAGVTITSTGGASSVTATNGSYMISGLSCSGSHTVTPSHSTNPVFSPSSRTVTVSGSNVTGVDFTTPAPTLTMGNILYPSQESVSVKDLPTGAQNYVYGYPGYNVYPDTIVPYRSRQSIAIIGSNVGGISERSLVTPGYEVDAIPGSYDLDPWCPAWPADWPAVSFDLTPSGDFAVLASNCTTSAGVFERRDIFLVEMRYTGASVYIRVTNDLDFDSQPVIFGVDSTTRYVTVAWFRNGTEIWTQVIDPVNKVRIGGVTLFASNVMGGVRAMSVNATYTHVAFMKNVGGVSHITIKPIAGGAEVVIVAGTDPYWSLDGSDLIMYTDASALWAIKPDGTGKVSVPIPSNLVGGIGKAVFGPPGYVPP